VGTGLIVSLEQAKREKAMDPRKNKGKERMITSE
jgi:hypothetical protein